MKERIALTACCLAAALFCFGKTAQAAPALSLPPPPHLGASAAILMDYRTGQVLYEQNGYRRRSPASTTKIMTAILALKYGNLNRIVRVSLHAAATPGSSMHLRAGQKYTLGDLLQGLLLRSGNDAATAIAETVSGTEAKFAVLMNQEAARLGARNTRFVNPHGLTIVGHYSSAHDLALLSRYAFHDPRFARIVGSKAAVATELSRGQKVLMRSTNRLLWYYPGIDGVKTGTTNAAGPCLVASASRNGWRLIAVVLNSPDRWGDAPALLDYGFANYTPVQLVQAGDLLRTVPVTGGVGKRVTVIAQRDLNLVVPRPELGQVRLKLTLPPVVEAPVAKGQPLGTLVASLGDRIQGRTVLLATTTIPARSPEDLFWFWLTEAVRWLEAGGLV